MSNRRAKRRAAQQQAAAATNGNGQAVAEAYNFQGAEFVDRRDWGPVGWGFANGMFGFGVNLMSSLNDHADGKNRPFVENEYDAATIRGFARFITTINCPGIGIIENLQNYIIGEGIKVTVATKKGKKAPDGLVEFAQDVIDEFNEDNKIIGDFDRERLLIDRVDGEAYTCLYPKMGPKRGSGKTFLRSLEPDAVQDPKGVPFDDRELSEIYNLNLQYPTHWPFGHHVDVHDIQKCHGYCVRWGTAEPFDYLPARYVHFSKVNVRRNVLRGMSDFYPAWKWLKQQERLLDNTGEGAAVLAAIAYITQFANATQEQVRNMRESQAQFTYSRVGMGGQTQTVYKNNRDPGSVVNMPQGQEFLPGPMGHERGQAFLQVVQGILRQVGTRWCMTEGMISGDDSNNNMASAVEAGGRFWKYAVAAQGRECTKWKEIYIIVLQNAFDMGLFDRFGMTWDQIKQVLTITVVCPEVDVRDPNELTQKRKTESEAGILSDKTWATEAGYDYDKEVAQGAKKAVQGDPMGAPGGFGRPGQPGAVPGQPGAFGGQQPRQLGEYEDKSRLQWKRNTRAIKDVLDGLQAKTMNAVHAKLQLGLLGLNPERIDALIADLMDDGQLSAANTADLAETEAAHVSPHWRLVREAGTPFSVLEDDHPTPIHPLRSSKPTFDDVVAVETKLHQAGWSLRDYHQQWLVNGEALVYQVPIEGIIPREDEPIDTVTKEDPKVQGILANWEAGHRAAIVEGHKDAKGRFHMFDGRHRTAAARERGRTTVPMIVKVSAPDPNQPKDEPIDGPKVEVDPFASYP